MSPLQLRRGGGTEFFRLPCTLRSGSSQTFQTLSFPEDRWVPVFQAHRHREEGLYSVLLSTRVS